MSPFEKCKVFFRKRCSGTNRRSNDTHRKSNTRFTSSNSKRMFCEDLTLDVQLSSQIYTYTLLRRQKYPSIPYLATNHEVDIYMLHTYICCYGCIDIYALDHTDRADSDSYIGSHYLFRTLVRYESNKKNIC